MYSFYGRAKLGTNCIQAKGTSHGVYDDVLYYTDYLTYHRSAVQEEV